MARAPKPEDKPQEITTPEDAKRLPSTYIDTYFISTWPGHVRMVFGEGVGDEAFYRLAVVLPLEIVEDLIETLTKMVKAEKERDAKEP
jgi:hypothetical protein